MAPKIESKWIKVKDVNTHYLVGGEGLPLLLVNGGGAATVENDWAPNLEPLAQHYQIYAPDLVGYGKTDKPKIRYTQKLFIEFLDDFTATLGLDRMSIIGHSLGGGISLAYTLNHPEKVEKLVLIDTAGLSNDLTPLGKALLGIFKTVARLKKDETYYSTMTGGGDGEVHEVFMDRLWEIKAPTLICWGQWDGYMPVKLAYQAHKRLPNSQLHIFKRGWHAPHRSRAEEFNRLALDFLRQ
ncbi:MAG: alpha/beta hydrolase [Dehalococcoidia bacterium]|nr:alpha/beta hydrolase [Dehalococcoidia bacterium]